MRYGVGDMNDVWMTGIKAVNGGLFVVASALVGAMALPKRFAGLFSAAPSVALANLIVIALVKGPSDAQQQSTGMIVGAVAMVVACAAGIVLVARWRARRGSIAMWGVWLVIAEAGYLVALR